MTVVLHSELQVYLPTCTLTEYFLPIGVDSLVPPKRIRHLFFGIAHLRCENRLQYAVGLTHQFRKRVGIFLAMEAFPKT